MAGRKMYNPSSNTATNAKYTLLAENGAIGGSGRIVRSQRKSVTTKRISIIMVSASVKLAVPFACCDVIDYSGLFWRIEVPKIAPT
jgi:hypothetical protein